VTLAQLQVFENPESVARAVADNLTNAMAADIDTRGECHVVLTGGTVGIALLRFVTSTGSIDWSRVHLWWGDERFVASDSPDRNVGQASEALINRIDIPRENVHPIASSTEVANVEDAARRYSRDLEEFFGVDFPHFDIVLLGVGPDGHVASLFPHLPGVTETGLTVIPVDNSPKPPSQRVSLTLPSLNAARRVWLVAAGLEKENAVRDALRSIPAEDSPVSAVRGIEETILFVDDAAASAVHVTRDATE